MNHKIAVLFLIVLMATMINAKVACDSTQKVSCAAALSKRLNESAKTCSTPTFRVKRDSAALDLADKCCQHPGCSDCDLKAYMC